MNNTKVHLEVIVITTKGSWVGTGGANRPVGDRPKEHTMPSRKEGKNVEDIKNKHRNL